MIDDNQIKQSVMTVTDYKRYPNREILVHFEGEYSETEVIDFVSERYEDGDEFKVFDYFEPSEYMGLKNCGSVYLQKQTS